MNKHKCEIVRTDQLDLVYWAHIESKEAITSDGRMVGLVRGWLVDPKKWTVPLLVIVLNEDFLEELKIKKPMQSSLVTIPTSCVKHITYMVQLNVDLETFIDTVSEYYVDLP